MATVRKVAKPWKPIRWQKVAIYARISTTRKGQLNSIANQVSQLTEFVYKRAGWVLVDIYLDFESGSGSHFRPQFDRMVNDAQEGKFDILLTKSVTRFGRNTEENLITMRVLLKSGVVIYFHMEEIESSQPDAEFLVSLLSGIAEADNKSHREDRM